MNDTELNTEFVNLIRKIAAIDEAAIEAAVTEHMYHVDLSDHIDQASIVDDVIENCRYDIDRAVEDVIDERLSTSEIEVHVADAVNDLVSNDDIKNTIASEVAHFLSTEAGKAMIESAIHNVFKKVFNA